ncbi:hypothetical protein H0H87_004134 [Tephrocybe sp. NHM501043]|nr:hypothetical protein H0H87_004134 [Tephrocybe sp. NHM501043]
MDPLRELRNLIATTDSEGRGSREEHKKIYQFIKLKVLSPKSPFIKQVPPLLDVVKTIYTLFEPKLDTRHISDLLDLLATVEFYRKRTLDHANLATIWNNHYNEDSNTDCLPLDYETAEFLQQLVSQAGAMRDIYITLILTCCSLYFPTLNANYAESPRLFWTDLSREETAKISNLGRECSRLVRESNSADKSRTINSALNENQEKTWPNLCRDEMLSELVSYYTSHITATSEKVQLLFPAADKIS